VKKTLPAAEVEVELVEEVVTENDILEDLPASFRKSLVS
jgi:hypothetical protein